MVLRVSVGLAVYNGENYLEQAVDSILAQTFTDFELIISDNASTDRTQEICRNYIAKDPRVRYYRFEKNMGAARNLNRVFELSTGKYFKWAAHDDVCAPENLERCVEVLDCDASVVLCYPKTIIIHEAQGTTQEYCDGFNFSSADPYERYRKYHEQVRYGHESHPVFGLIRADVLRQTCLIGGYVSSDRVLLGELVLRGKFHEVPEFLFFKRNHPQTSIKGCPTNRMRTAWFDPTRKGKIQLTHWRMFFEYLGGIKRVPLDGRDKLLCRLQMVKWLFWYSRWLAKDLLKVLVWPFIPRSLKD
ncbi:MAG: glycosyltransferase family 2 protein [Planctomycetota bacterium]|jgi:glycosyltransferase involved in cell wall biosynthesis